jgi:TetR/AcrR family transcriptional repressor of uid operon
MAITSIDSKREGNVDRRERRRLETRERLYEAAMEEFQREGFARAQIDRIVDRAGVARGTFYFHFPTKEHVLLELQRRTEASIVDRLKDLHDSRLTVRQFLARVMEAIAAEGPAVGGRSLSRELMAMYVREPRVVDASADPLIVTITDYFTDAAERGEVRTDLSPEEITLIFLTCLYGFVSSAVEGIEERLEDFGRIIDVFVRGISP